MYRIVDIKWVVETINVTEVKYLRATLRTEDYSACLITLGDFDYIWNFSKDKHVVNRRSAYARMLLLKALDKMFNL